MNRDRPSFDRRGDLLRVAFPPREGDPEPGTARIEEDPAANDTTTIVSLVIGGTRHVIMAATGPRSADAVTPLFEEIHKMGLEELRAFLARDGAAEHGRRQDREAGWS